MELPRPVSVPCAYNDRYSCDVLVIGCGFAGLNAAVSAREKGMNVIVVDKGKPGYSGLSAWPSSFRWFDSDRGDDEDLYWKTIQMGGDYVCNKDWYFTWIRESKSVYERLSKWGILVQFPRATEAGNFFEHEDFVGYRETFEKFDRRQRFVEVLENNGINWLEHTMITDVLKDENGVTGAMGFHVPSGKVITISAKAVVMAMGTGSYKPTGYPVGDDTFDGEYIAYNLGLPIAGKEYEDTHNCNGSGVGNAFAGNHWQYLENIWLCGGDITPENHIEYVRSKGNILALSRIRKGAFGVDAEDGTSVADVREASFTRIGASAVYGQDPEEVRCGKKSTPTLGEGIPGAAIGMCHHLSSGVFTGLEGGKCAAGIPGLYVAGDGTHATMPNGATYPVGVGFTSCFCSIDGWHAGEGAAEFAAGAQLREISDEEAEAVSAAITAPLNVEKGYDANWARDVLHGIMAPYWVSAVKTEAMLNAALVQVEYMRDHVVPKLQARTSHDLRLCIEMKHKVQSAELKLRAGLERKESRGTHYRADFPYRDDENFLCYMTARKGENGEVIFDKIPVPDEWAGDKNVKYEERYVYYYPGEEKAKGFTAPKTGGWGGKGGGKPGNGAAGSGKPDAMSSGAGKSGGMNTEVGKSGAMNSGADKSGDINSEAGKGGR